MNFKLEEIDKNDYVKYRFAEINNNFRIGVVRSKQWVVNSDRDIFVRLLAVGREDNHRYSDWDIYSCGNRLIVEAEMHVFDKMCKIDVRVTDVLEGEKLDSTFLKEILFGAWQIHPYISSKFGFIPTAFDINVI